MNKVCFFIPAIFFKNPNQINMKMGFIEIGIGIF